MLVLREVIAQAIRERQQITDWTATFIYKLYPVLRDGYTIVAGCRTWRTFAEFRAHYNDPEWLGCNGHNHKDPEAHRQGALKIADEMEAFVVKYGVPMMCAEPAPQKPKQKRKTPAKRKPKARKRR